MNYGVKKMSELQDELKKVNDMIELEKNNLIILLKKINIEYIDLLSYHYRFNDLINKRDLLENKIFDLKMKK